MIKVMTNVMIKVMINVMIVAGDTGQGRLDIILTVAATAVGHLGVSNRENVSKYIRGT